MKWPLGFSNKATYFTEKVLSSKKPKIVEKPTPSKIIYNLWRKTKRDVEEQFSNPSNLNHYLIFFI